MTGKAGPRRFRYVSDEVNGYDVYALDDGRHLGWVTRGQPRWVAFPLSLRKSAASAFRTREDAAYYLREQAP